jgi:hypothetical protein
MSFNQDYNNKNYNYYTNGNDLIDMTEYNSYREIVHKNIGYDSLVKRRPSDKDVVDEIIGIMIDCICSKLKYIRVNQNDMPKEVIKSQFLKINAGHIFFVLNNLAKAEDVSNMRQYMITVIYNASISMNLCYETGG